MLIRPHLIGAGMGGQFAHKPSSTVRSRLRRKNGTTSVMPALVTVLLPHDLNVAAAASFSGVPSFGAFGWSENLEMVAISLWKCCSKGCWKDFITAMSSSPEKSAGLLRPVRYVSNSARPPRKDSAVRKPCQPAFGRPSARFPQELTMLLMSFPKYRFVPQQLLDLGEERGLLVVMVRLDKLEPGEAVPNKVGLVLVENERGLVVDGIVATEDRVV